MGVEAPDLVWSGLLLAGAAFEVYALKNQRPGDTLSESTRRWFKVNTAAGRWVFGMAWVTFAVWFGVHIISG